ncbi:hypothetical protein CFN78_06660 [Amycolatopsis antarctica]|uniref:Uncharacterized protein n=1 Tax=Amycolatopsis antarctica TaxID=1854586 RepID=A0A263D6C0_9PSEU|nr:hypothetical protein [Amycolatopsis antarctica]OZM73963.1 hypothetical protein CFN78_06660 [Amycolatopsis antarctica]
MGIATWLLPILVLLALLPLAHRAVRARTRQPGADEQAEAEQIEKMLPAFQAANALTRARR